MAAEEQLTAPQHQVCLPTPVTMPAASMPCHSILIKACGPPGITGDDGPERSDVPSHLLDRATSVWLLMAGSETSASRLWFIVWRRRVGACSPEEALRIPIAIA